MYLIPRFIFGFLCAITTLSGASLNTYITGELSRREASGVAVAVIANDKIVAIRAYGTDSVTGQPLSVDAPFALGAVGELFTATGIALLFDDNKLTFSGALKELWPRFAVIDPYISQHLTLRDLLSHRSGLRRHNDAIIDVGQALKQMDQVVKWRTSALREPIFDDLVRGLGSRVAKQPWRTFLRQRLLRPLGMNRTRVPIGGYGGQISGRESQVAAIAVARKSDVDISTVLELARFIQCIIAQGRYNQVPIISPESIREMLSPHVHSRDLSPEQQLFPGLGDFRSYGLAWQLMLIGDDRVCGARAVLDDHTVVVAIIPESWLGVVVVMSGKDPSFADAVAAGVLLSGMR